MEHVPSKEYAYVEDEIDIRAIVTTLWRYRWLLLSITLALAVAAFAFSKLVLPREYEGTAIVILTKPVFSTNLDARIQTNPQLPDSRSLTDLAKADDLLMEMIQSPETSGLFDKNLNLEKLKKRLDVTLIGTSQLRLVVTDTDPQRAAQIANYWALQYTRRLNNLFDVNEFTLSQIEQQRASAYQKWADAQQALMDYLPNNRVSALGASLEQARTNLKSVLEKVNQIDLLISDIKLLETRLARQPQNVLLSLEDLLSLIALQQRSVGGESIIQVQASGKDILQENDTVAEARNSLKELMEALTIQRKELEAEIERSDQLITSLGVELEQAQYQLTRLTMERDFALNAYQALSNQEEETRIALAQNDQVARVASQALVPQQEVGPHAALNGALAGMLGLIVSTVVIFALEWWQSSPPGERKLQVEQGKTP